jgi:hypothetical protein
MVGGKEDRASQRKSKSQRLSSCKLKSMMSLKLRKREMRSEEHSLAVPVVRQNYKDNGIQGDNRTLQIEFAGADARFRHKNTDAVSPGTSRPTGFQKRPVC